MARRVSVGELQQMQRGELDADREAAGGGASLDPLSGQIASNGKGPGFQSPARTVAEQLRELVLEDDIAGMPLGQVDGLLRRAVEAAHVNATAAEIRAEAERRWLDGKLEEAPIEPKPEDRADVIDALAEATLGGRVAEITVQPSDGINADQVVTLNPDGTVAEVRPAEMTPDRGEGVGETHHTITDDEPRWSGGGAGWQSTNDNDNLGGRAPWMVLRVPTDAEFGEDEYVASTALAHRAEILTERHPDLFGHLADLKVVYLWKKAGGKSKGKGVYGKTAKASGLVKHFSEKAAFVIWLAADHCRGANYSERQLEALLFHEMCHTSVAEEDPETGRGGGATLVPHDVEMFRAEVEVYGLWDADLRDVAPAFRQGNLFDAPVQRSGSAVANAGAGVLIHADGSPLTDDEIEAMERHELNDDPAEDDEDLDDMIAEGFELADQERAEAQGRPFDEPGYVPPDDVDEGQHEGDYEAWLYDEPPDTSGELPTGDEIDAARAASGFAASAEGGKEDTDILLDDPAVL